MKHLKVFMAKAAYVLALLTSFFALHLAGCKKSSGDVAGEHYKLDSEALKYIQLGLNKYFIYKDSATGVLDSVVVTKSEFTESFIPGTPGSLSPISLGSPAQYVEHYSLVLTRYGAGTSAPWLTGKASAGYYNVGQTSFVDEFQNQAFHFPASCTTCSGAHYAASVTIEGKVYTDIMFTDGPNISYYWSKGVGIIKRKVNVGAAIKTFVLLRNG